MTKIFSAVLIATFLISCSLKTSEKKENEIKRYYINFAEMGFECTKSDTLPWSKENLLDSLLIYYNKKPILIKKFSNYPNDPIDGGYVAFYEESIGVFYLKSTTWRSFSLLRTNDDSTNYYIDVLLGSILANSKMFLNPRQIDDLNRIN